MDQIEADGFPVSERVEMVLASDTATAVAKSFGLGVIGYADALERLRPEILMVLGDRYEALAVTVAAALRLLPVAHIGGGELSYGSTDDSVRHAITKLAHLHFTSNEEFRQRVIQLGEDPSRVHAFGAPGLDTIRTMPLLGRGELAEALGLDLTGPLFAVTYHPATADPRGSRDGVLGLLAALDRLPEATVVFTGTNVDQGGAGVFAPIRDYVSAHPGRAMARASLGQVTYLSLVAQAAVVIGNSSSGLAEAPALRTATVNIGSRQDGRPRAGSVIDCGESAAEIEGAIRQSLSAEHQAIAAVAVSPFGDGHAAERIAAVLKIVSVDALTVKGFADVTQPSGDFLDDARLGDP
ncbi:UDP-N-acetylglucosamine 2-epimerase (non-hydrolyzing)/GDP/UDP-N,N'-diacetylbacillosamine 2-epimerase (hydrolyzing) [Jiangella mangrovi]|uniref:UDP-N-acetylglucosamine 2-epimerase (Non-hydrolyzing)/GDP/UDP-N,N'-diacetylbacillosamine 2-epimerase (Hydrolyzing) n=1 Tax=Jiangella mangrovi TaxID=1524084 RepID=A0A7W9GX83_9ACTN|nr:UDP-N-acetylglucosamine 2-epimerase (non-hydrolyzing)/GDP/UDP-N,N'-diacetylbacillosamine 2-epimerase (hydrolyzing) [Jiangella mangrovi]